MLDLISETKNKGKISVWQALFPSLRHELMLTPNMIIFRIHLLFFPLQSHFLSLRQRWDETVFVSPFLSHSSDSSQFFGWFLRKAAGIWTCSLGLCFARIQKEFLAFHYGDELHQWINLSPRNSYCMQLLRSPCYQVTTVASLINEKVHWRGG